MALTYVADRGVHNILPFATKRKSLEEKANRDCRKLIRSLTIAVVLDILYQRRTFLKSHI